MKIEGGYKKPVLRDLVGIKIVLLPWTISYFFYEKIRWLVLYTIMKKEYTKEDKILLTKKEFHPYEWDDFCEEDKEYYIER